MECSYHYKNGNLQFVSSIDVFGNQPERFGTVLRGAVAVLEGYKYDKAHDIYICNYCAQKFLLIQNNNTLTQNQKI